MPASPESSLKGKTLGVIAGAGNLPGKLLNACDRRGQDVFVVAIDGQTNLSLVKGRNHMMARIGAAGKIIKTLKSHDRGGMISALNAGDNVLMFPEANTNDGTCVNRFNAGLTEIAYGSEGTGDKGEVLKLEKEICVQPIAIIVKDVEGRDALADPALCNNYSLFYERSHLKRIWQRLQCGGITLELTVFPPMEPENYPDAKALMNAAHGLVRQVAAPDQTDVKRSTLGNGGFGPPPV